MAKAKPQTIDWQNRIVEYGQQPADQFLAHDLNARRHPNAQRDALRGSLNAVGWIAPVIVSQRSGKLLDGHARIEEALSRSESALVPFVLVDVSEAEEAIILGTFDPITGMATYDREVLDTLLREIETNDAGLQSLLEELAAKNDLYLTDDAAKPSAGGDDFDTTPEETQTRVQYGDLWQCGEHRVLCGDSTKAEDVARVMDGEKASMCFTDPPYNVAYGSNPNPRHKIRSIQNDALGEEFTPFITKALERVLAETTGALYICMSDKEWARMFTILEGLNAHWSSTIVWVKDRLVLSPKDYHSRHELIWYGWREGGRRLPLEDRTKTDVWEVARPSRSDEHPTMKPVELVVIALDNSSKLGDLVYEPFGGSGTTLIACERTNRKARVIEIEPKYVNVILSRWEAETGREAKLLERMDG